MLRRRRAVFGVGGLLFGAVIGVGGAGARVTGEVPGITVHAQQGVVADNLGIYGFFTKTGVKCSDFKPAPVVNPAVRFGPIVITSHPENGKPGCLVQAQTIEFLKAGTIPFQFTLTETGVFTGTDTIDDTAVVTADPFALAKALVRKAVSAENAADAAALRFEVTQQISSEKRAVAEIRQAESDLRAASKLISSANGNGGAANAISRAEADDLSAIQLLASASHSPPAALRKDASRADDRLEAADDEKATAIKLLNKT